MKMPISAGAGAPDRASAPPAAETEFLARVSHEIRTPLNVVLGTLELLRQTRASAEQLEYLELMKTAGESLSRLVGDILDHSRIEAGGMPVEAVPFSLARCIDDTVRLMQVEAGRKGLGLRAEVTPGLPDAVRGDPLRLRQVLTNLLANAIRFSNRGEIVLRAGPASGDGADPACRFSVADQGIGIPADRLAKIFAPWCQADDSTGRCYGGSGLGLSIAARLVALMGGEMGVDSTPGIGSTFHFTARFGRIEAMQAAGRSPAPHRAAPPCAGDRFDILLVEDNPLNSRLARMVLERVGHRVLPAATGRAALDLLAEHPVDLVLMDLQLPDMDGMAVVAAIRQLESRLARRRTPVAALTADVRPETRLRCRQAGMDGYLTKPVEPAALAALVSRPPPLPPGLALDRRALMRQVQGDRRLLGEVRDLFRRDSRRLLARIRQAIAGRDEPALAESLHTLRGMFRSLAAGAAELTVSELASSAGDAALTEAAYARLCGEVAALAEALQQLTREIPGVPRPGMHALTGKATPRRSGHRLPPHKPRHRLPAAAVRPVVKGVTP